MKLIKKSVGEYQPTWYQSENGRFTVEDCSHRNASGARWAKSLGFKYEVTDHQTYKTYKTSTIKDAKWWISEQIESENR